MLYLSYQAQVMDNTTKNSIRKEICSSLKEIFIQILNPEIPEKQQIWENFCQSEEAVHFWKKFEEIYRALVRWTKSTGSIKKTSYLHSCYDLMAMMLGFSTSSLREKFGESMLKDAVNQFNGTMSYQIFRDYLYYLKFSIDYTSTSTPNPSTGQSLTTSTVSVTIQENTSFYQQLLLISENIVPKVSDVIENDQTIKLLVEIGVELGYLDIKLSMNIVRILLTSDYSIGLKSAALSMLRILAQNNHQELTKNNFHVKLFDLLYNYFLQQLIIVQQRDQAFLQQPQQTIKQSRDSSQEIHSNEMIVAQLLLCFPHFHAPPEKRSILIDKITELSRSLVFDIAESAIFALRDFVLLQPGQNLMLILSITLNSLCDYFQKDEDQIKRLLYNLSVLLYYINQAIGMDFDVDGIQPDKFVLLRCRIEGTLLVWLCSPYQWVYVSAWKLLEQLSTPQIRRLEFGCDSPVLHLIDHLPRPRTSSNNVSNATNAVNSASIRTSITSSLGGSIGSDDTLPENNEQPSSSSAQQPHLLISGTSSNLLTELPAFFHQHYNSYFCAINWAWSNLFEVASSSNSLSDHGLNKWSSYFKLLCIIPRHAPEDANFEEKSHYLSKSFISRFFTQIAVLLSNLQGDDLYLITESLKLLHPTCYQVLIQSIIEFEDASASAEFAHPPAPSVAPSSRTSG